MKTIKPCIGVSDNNYYAKATVPAANNWRTGMMTEKEAIRKANWFVRQWLVNGLASVEACVFYRDGNVHKTINKNNIGL